MTYSKQIHTFTAINGAPASSIQFNQTHTCQAIHLTDIFIALIYGSTSSVPEFSLGSLHETGEVPLRFDSGVRGSDSLARCSGLSVDIGKCGLEEMTPFGGAFVWVIGR
jgi:hypothetical protein